MYIQVARACENTACKLYWQFVKYYIFVVTTGSAVAQ